MLSKPARKAATNLPNLPCDHRTMGEGQLPGWLACEPPELHDFLIELMTLRSRDGVWGLRVRSKHITKLLQLARQTLSGPQSQSQFLPMRALFVNRLLPGLDNTNRDACVTYFNLNGQQDSTERRRAKAGARFGQTYAVFRDPISGQERPFLIRIAKKINEIQLAYDRGELYVPQSAGVPYVYRKELHGSLKEAIAKGVKIIALTGESGTGKTTLAKRFSLMEGSEDGQQVMVLRASGKRGTSQDIIEELGRLQMPSEYLSDAGASAGSRLRKLLADSISAPKFTIFDDVATWDDISDLLSGELANTILITSQRDILPSEKGITIQVGSMTTEEATELICDHLPDASEDEIACLSETTCGRAIAISQLCAFLDQHPASRHGGFLGALKQHTVPTLGLVATKLNLERKSSEVTLEFTYRKAIAALKSDGTEATYAGRLLELISFTEPEGIPKGLLKACLYDVDGLPDNDVLRDEAYSVAIGILSTHYFVEIRGDRVSMHPLTRGIFREVFKPKAKEICSALLRSFDRVEQSAHFEVYESVWTIYEETTPRKRVVYLHIDPNTLPMYQWSEQLLEQKCAVLYYLQGIDSSYRAEFNLVDGLYFSAVEMVFNTELTLRAQEYFEQVGNGTTRRYYFGEDE